MGDYKMIVFNVVFIIVTFNKPINETGFSKTTFIEASYIDENGELKVVRDEAWMFRFVRR